jgi:hypothetical protein
MSDPTAYVYAPFAAVDAAAQLCHINLSGLHETLLVPGERSDEFIVRKLHYYSSLLNPEGLDELFVPLLRHLAVSTALSSRLFLTYPLPHHALEQLFALMAERVLTNRHRDPSWPQRTVDQSLDHVHRHLHRLVLRAAEPASTLEGLEQVRLDAADAATYLAFASFLLGPKSRALFPHGLEGME